MEDENLPTLFHIFIIYFIKASGLLLKMAAAIFTDMLLLIVYYCTIFLYLKENFVCFLFFISIYVDMVVTFITPERN